MKKWKGKWGRGKEGGQRGRGREGKGRQRGKGRDSREKQETASVKALVSIKYKNLSSKENYSILHVLKTSNTVYCFMKYSEQKYHCDQFFSNPRVRAKLYPDELKDIFMKKWELCNSKCTQVLNSIVLALTSMRLS